MTGSPLSLYPFQLYGAAKADKRWFHKAVFLLERIKGLFADQCRGLAKTNALDGPFHPRVQPLTTPDTFFINDFSQ